MVEWKDLVPRTWPQIWLSQDFWMVTDGSGISNDKINIETVGDPPDE